MNSFNNWLVRLDLTCADYFTLKNTLTLASKFKPENIHFVYVLSKPDIPDEILQDIPDLKVTTISMFESIVKKRVGEYFPVDTIKIHVVEGNTTSEVLSLIDRLNCDLAILSRNGQHTESVIHKITRKAPCSILIMPQEIKETFKSILAPTDFSSHSRMGLENSQLIANEFKDCTIHILHVFEDATKYLNQPFETVYEVDKILSRKNDIDQKLSDVAEYKLNGWLENSNGDLEIVSHVSSVDRTKEISDGINQWIQANQPDLLVIGSRGQSAAMGVLIGSVSEQVYTEDYGNFVLVVKGKGENSGLIKALFGLK